MGSPYVLPKDASESERLDAQHYLMKMVMGASYVAPLASPTSLLDVGCGTGLWAIEMAGLFPGARVVGIDFDTSQIKQTKPSLIRWQEVDALRPLPFISNTFAYAHLRFGATWIPLVSWPLLLSELVRVTRPGGIIELVEGSMPTSRSAAYTGLCGVLSQVVRQRGLDEEAAVHLAGYARASGLENVEERWFSAGEQPDQQRLLYQTTVGGFKSVLPLIRKQCSPVDYAQYQTYLAEVEREPPHVTRLDVAVWGQKPANM